MLEQYVHDDLVFLDKTYKDFDGVLSNVTETLVDNNYVDKKFEEALLIREKEFPTGLQLDGYAVGIPHGGSQFVKREFVAVVTLQHPISMNRMDNPQESLAIDTLFILGFSNAETHLQGLKELMELIQNPNVIGALKKGTSIRTLL